MKRTAIALLIPLATAIGQTPPPAAQNPSPMVERTRAHARLVAETPTPGAHRMFAGLKSRSLATLGMTEGKPIELFVPEKARAASSLHLVIHFHGAAFVAEQAVMTLGDNHASAVVNLGAGGGVYDRTLSVPQAFDSLLASIQREMSAAVAHPVRFADVTLVGFSAGYGAVRAILRDTLNLPRVAAVLLLDGLHTSYIPEGTVVEKGGVLDTTSLMPFVRFGRLAVRGEKRFVITHSEIFPGTFASTTETTDYLVATLGLARKPVLRWGPGGMQQLSEATLKGMSILGFAGNAGPDHIDQLHGMPTFLRLVR
jgi:hypothetical protein